MSHARLLGLQHGPQTLTLVRHGESLANVADLEARETDAERLSISTRDADIELSPAGVEQARAVGRWLAQAPPEARPTVVLSSPYQRAQDTARHALESLEHPPALVLDERLRERDPGALLHLTRRGVQAEYATEAERFEKVGGFYYTPPSGESWADVTLRVRSLLGDLRQGFEGERVWLFCHQAVVMAFRFVLEGMDEARLLEVDRDERLPNASLTSYRREGPGYALVAYADTTALEAHGAEVTHQQPRRGD